MILNKAYKLIVSENGLQILSMDVEPSNYVWLGDVFRNHLSTMERAKTAMDKIRQLSWNDGESLKLTTNITCVTVKKNTTSVEGYFKGFEPFEMPTSDFIELANGWYTFFSRYEHGKIPGIIPDNKKQEWVIVPKSAVDKQFWIAGPEE